MDVKDEEKIWKRTKEEIGICDSEIAILTIADGPRMSACRLGSNNKQARAEEQTRATSFNAK